MVNRFNTLFPAVLVLFLQHFNIIIRVSKNSTSSAIREIVPTFSVFRGARTQTRTEQNRQLRGNRLSIRRGLYWLRLSKNIRTLAVNRLPLVLSLH